MLKPLLLIGVFFAMLAQADSTPAEQEIRALLAAIEQSLCTFMRNDNKHDGIEAAEHLQRKWQAQKKTIHSAEQFIAELATRSSMSGERYMMDCPGQALQTSEQWLTDTLQKIRANKNY